LQIYNEEENKAIVEYAPPPKSAKSLALSLYKPPTGRVAIDLERAKR